MRFAHGLAFIAGMILGLGIVTGELLDPTLLGAFACFASGGFLVIHRSVR